MDKQERLNELGELVKDRREALGLTIDQASELAPMSPVTWSRVEAGRSVRGLTYGAVDDVLGWAENSCTRFIKIRREPAARAALLATTAEPGGDLEAAEDVAEQLQAWLERRRGPLTNQQRAVVVEWGASLERLLDALGDDEKHAS